MKYLIHENDVAWVPHPSGLAGVEMIIYIFYPDGVE